jgi:hypothetical protein
MVGLFPRVRFCSRAVVNAPSRMKPSLRTPPPVSPGTLDRTRLAHRRASARRPAPALVGLSSLWLLVAACTLTSDDFEPQVIAGAPLTLAGAAPPDGACGGASCCEAQACPSDQNCRGGVCIPAGASEMACDGMDCSGDLNVALASSCDDGARNGDEASVDCGGSCSGCADGSACAGDADCASHVCTASRCSEPSCTDGVSNRDETGVDCGGSCTDSCAAGQGCAGDDDCGEGLFCAMTGLCTVVSCSDGVRNGGEVLADCGGPDCSGCPDGSACNTAADCASLVCDDGSCAAASCSDGVSNQGESSTDCGGSCEQKCSNGAGCNGAGDCDSGVCRAAGCAEGLNGCCQVPTCADRVRNGNESGTDCGGPDCASCPDLATCRQGSDCSNDNCDARGICISCGDGAVDGTETDIDCGGTDPACRRCNPGQRCRSNDDCLNTQCVSGVC